VVSRYAPDPDVKENLGAPWDCVTANSAPVAAKAYESMPPKAVEASMDVLPSAPKRMSMGDCVARR